MMNTEITYLYRDAANYKTVNTAIVKGLLTDQEISRIISCLHDGEYFIPGQVGLPENRGFAYDKDLDHIWFELDVNSFGPTEKSDDTGITAQELVHAFEEAKGNWEESEAIDRLERGWWHQNG